MRSWLISLLLTTHQRYLLCTAIMQRIQFLDESVYKISSKVDKTQEANQIKIEKDDLYQIRYRLKLDGPYIK